jgi:TetR/AcrR family transcriptional repressor of nem operon
MFERLVEEAEAETDDPLEQMMLFLEKFEEYISNSEDPSPGCMYAVVLDAYPPAIPVTARQLAELTVSIVEGGLIQQRAYGDVKVTKRQSLQLRNYLSLLFGQPKSKAA